MTVELSVINLAEARFECTFGRGCDGVCCREARPPVYPDEVVTIAAHLDKFLPLMRPAARAAVGRNGFLVPRRRRLGQRMMRVVRGWCAFFHQGCVLHAVGAAEGDKFRYKPSLCALFPIQQDNRDRWYVRQKGYKRERWDLFCLDPHACAVPARDSLRDEIALAHRFDDEQTNTAITDQGLANLQPIKSLRNVNIHNGKSVTATGIAELRKSPPSCQMSQLQAR